MNDCARRDLPAPRFGDGATPQTAAAGPFRWADISSAVTECYRARIAGGDYLVLRSHLAAADTYLARRTVGFRRVERAPGPFATLAAAKAWCEAHCRSQR